MKSSTLAATVGCVLAAASAPAATIVGAAQQAGTFTKLLAASKQAGVDTALKGQGPFTIFAPMTAPLPRCRPPSSTS